MINHKQGGKPLLAVGKMQCTSNSTPSLWHTLPACSHPTLRRLPLHTRHLATAGASAWALASLAEANLSAAHPNRQQKRVIIHGAAAVTHQVPLAIVGQE